MLSKPQQLTASAALLTVELVNSLQVWATAVQQANSHKQATADCLSRPTGCALQARLKPATHAQELILFSRADLERSIPSMVDGLKPGQRKILFACFKRNLRKEIKVLPPSHPSGALAADQTLMLAQLRLEPFTS